MKYLILQLIKCRGAGTTRLNKLGGTTEPISSYKISPFILQSLLSVNSWRHETSGLLLLEKVIGGTLRSMGVLL
uniref:Uncharacterized protein n=1 Tax=Salix viminalis TaxID=40686 RepID=A0A6N2N7V4_SALVM